MPTLTPVIVFGLIATGASARLDEEVAPKFSIGDTVEMKNINPVTHTCLPRYVRGKKGIVERDRGVFAFPDTAAHGQGHKAQYVNSIKFSFRELWGEDHAENMFLFIDMFDDYMRRAT